MRCTAHSTTVREIARWREQYRREMDCQIVHDSFHGRPGWTREYALEAGGRVVGYGSIVEAGPWVGRPTVYEVYVEPEWRGYGLDLFEALVVASRAVGIEVQTNDLLLSVMLHTFGQSPCCEKILFHDVVTTLHERPELVFREAGERDGAAMGEAGLDPEAKWVVEAGGRVVAGGGILYHYNPPYGDIYMAVAEAFRGRGIGAYLVQELKRVCREGGHIPAARCNPQNTASRKALRNAGFAPCGNLLSAALAAARSRAE